MAEKAKRLVKGYFHLSLLVPKRNATGPGSQTGEGDSDYCGAESVVSVTDSIASTNHTNNENKNKKKNKDTKDSESWVVVGKDKPIIGEAALVVNGMSKPIIGEPPMIVSFTNIKPSNPRDSVTSKAKQTTHTEPKNRASRLARDKVRTQKMCDRPEVKPRTMQGPAQGKRNETETTTTDVLPRRKEAEVKDVETIHETKEEAATTDVIPPKRKDAEVNDVESVPETKEEAEARARTGHDAHCFVWPR
ncbi:hypothetical protein GE09DRAFT_1223890 [Coniochaeta sp. 2T2.1]|nr:hypothetical protein GE09DRAFT_1223890 [Coniochaeta sp. 2T2.1]